MSGILEKLKNLPVTAIACAGLAVLAAVLLFLLLRSRSQRKKLAAEIVRQKERVRVRKKKIYELRSAITQLKAQLLELQQKKAKPTASQDTAEQYRKLTDDFRALTERIGHEVEDKQKAEALTEQVHSLSYKVRTAMGVQPDAVLAYGSEHGTGQDGRKSYIGCRVLVAEDDPGHAELCQ